MRRCLGLDGVGVQTLGVKTALVANNEWALNAYVCYLERVSTEEVLCRVWSCWDLVFQINMCSILFVWEARLVSWD